MALGKACMQELNQRLGYNGINDVGLSLQPVEKNSNIFSGSPHPRKAKQRKGTFSSLNQIKTLCTETHLECKADTMTIRNRCLLGFRVHTLGDNGLPTLYLQSKLTTQRCPQLAYQGNSLWIINRLHLLTAFIY